MAARLHAWAQAHPGTRFALQMAAIVALWGLAGYVADPLDLLP